MLSIICGVTLSILLNPNPHRLINGAQVISKAPPDFLEISSALLNTSVNHSSTSTSSLLLTLAIVELGLKGFKERLKRCSSLSILSVRICLALYLMW